MVAIKINTRRMNVLLIEGFLLGLATGPVCIGYCSPVLIPLLTGRSDKQKYFAKSVGILLQFLGGRLVGYLLIGLACGVLGEKIVKISHSTFSSIALLLCGILLIFNFFNKQLLDGSKSGCHPLVKHFSGWTQIVAFGFLTGINLCPPFLAAMTSAALLGSVGKSVLYFLAFFLATALFFPPIILFSKFAQKKTFQQIAHLSMIMTGSWFILKSSFQLIILAYTK